METSNFLPRSDTPCPCQHSHWHHFFFFTQKSWLFYWVGYLATIFRWILEVAGMYTNTAQVSSRKISFLASFWFCLMCCRADVLSVKPFCFKTAGLSVQSLEEDYVSTSVFPFLRNFMTSPKGHPQTHKINNKILGNSQSTDQTNPMG